MVDKLILGIFLYQVRNIDGVLEHHNDFLDRCLKDCMLTNPDLLKVTLIPFKYPLD